MLRLPVCATGCSSRDRRASRPKYEVRPLARAVGDGGGLVLHDGAVCTGRDAERRARAITLCSAGGRVARPLIPRRPVPCGAVTREGVRSSGMRVLMEQRVEPTPAVVPHERFLRPVKDGPSWASDVGDALDVAARVAPIRSSHEMQILPRRRIVPVVSEDANKAAVCKDDRREIDQRRLLWQKLRLRPWTPG
eukprot:5121703-Prymnesium_polylepis.1